MQIGSDPDARAFLQELDDDLRPQLGVRDMVDWCVRTFLFATVVAALMRRLRQPTARRLKARSRPTLFSRPHLAPSCAPLTDERRRAGVYQWRRNSL